MTCFEEATEQFVWVDINTGLHRISQPMCEDCSHEAQPAESVAVFSVEGEGLPCYGEPVPDTGAEMHDNWREAVWGLPRLGDEPVPDTGAES